MADATFNTVGSLLDGASSVGSSILDNASGMAGSVLDAATDIGGSLMDTIGDLASGAVEGAGDVAQGLADFAGDALSATGDLAGAVMDTAVGLAEGAMDMMSNIADGLMDSASDSAEDLFGDTMDDVDGVIEEYDDDMQELMEEVDDAENELDEENWDEDWTEDGEDWNEDWELPEDDEDEPYDPTEDLNFWENVFNPQEGVDDPDNDNDGGEGKGEGGDETNEEPDEPPPSTAPSTAPNAKPTRPEEEVSTPMGWESPMAYSSKMDIKESNESYLGWNGWPAATKLEKSAKDNLMFLMRDGDQQLFNPYGHINSEWTIYSFRPFDAKQQYPQIAITPASFQALDSMDDMLDKVPYIVVKEFFFKNQVDTMVNFVQKIGGLVKEAFTSPEDSTTENTQVDAQSTTSSSLKDKATTLMNKIKSVFQEFPTPQAAVIDLPYILYVGLRKRLYGNTYIFPYIVDEGTVINQSSNEPEWGDENGGFLQGLRKSLGHVVEMIGGMASGLTGSMARPVGDLFPAPTWNGPKGEKPSFKMDLMLINDNALKARNNYMCVNTIIHNNRSMQKAIMNFPGALYELWLPTGQRHLMCTGSFELSPLGLNRHPPSKFFDDAGVQGATWRIGSSDGRVAQMQQPHDEKTEVIPDGYKLSITFKSCLDNNMNSSVFQYYVKMTGYEGYGKDEGGKESRLQPDLTPYKNLFKNPADSTAGDVATPGSGTNEQSAASTVPSTNSTTNPTNPTTRMFSKAVSDLMDDMDNEDDTQNVQENFLEATYNKRLERIKSQFGDLAVNTDSVVNTMRKSKRTVRETKKLLKRLYNAESNNLWYKTPATDELYTTIEPDYRQILVKQYGRNLRDLRKVQSAIDNKVSNMVELDKQLSNETNLSQRDDLLVKKVRLQDEIHDLLEERDGLADEAIQIDTDLLQSAYDEHDKAVSVKRRTVTPRIFQQVWNEKIMNSYEKDKLQFLTSQEKKRYFEEKIRDLRKVDEYGILNHPDWFFRVVVLDFVVQEMETLMMWFKNCSCDDFDTIYKIVRKLNLLQMDVDAARDKNQSFNINKTNLFHLSDDDVFDFTKLDNMLNGNTLYELFISQLSLKFTRLDSDVSKENTSEGGGEDEKKELAQEQKSELDREEQRKVRQDIVARFWKSESNLTKAAYAQVMDNDDGKLRDTGLEYKGEPITSIKQLKDAIIELKISGVDASNPTLQQFLGAFSNEVQYMKEFMLAQKMEEMSQSSTLAYNEEVQNVNAPVE